ncbi:MAG: flagellin lysine-N-methylase [Oscillospiraceae bacterium]
MYYRQPQYFSSFRCIGGTCRFSCCVGWNISMTDGEVEKVKNAPDCSPHVRSLMESSFERTESEPKRNRVVTGKGFRCPMLTEDNLCVVQKELGEDYLCETCREFPRKYRMAFDAHTKHFSHIYRSCHLSCPEVAKRLMTDKKAMNLVNVPVKESDIPSATRRDSNETLKERPEYLYRIDLFELFYSMISDRKIPLEQALTRGAFIADMFTKVVEDKQQSLIPQLIPQLKTQFSTKTQFRGIDDIVPNPKGKLIVLGEMMNMVGNNLLHLLRDENGGYDLEKYKRGEENLAKALGGEDFPLRNIALNLLMELNVPFYSEKYSIFENYSLFMTAFGAIRLNLICAASEEAERISLYLAEDYTAEFSEGDVLSGFTSVISRVLCQSHEVADKLLSYLRTEGISKPAALSVMVR